MSYSALTGLGSSDEAICPRCLKPILDEDVVLLVLKSVAYVVPSYNEENDMPRDSVTVGMDWTNQVAYHDGCLKVDFGDE